MAFHIDDSAKSRCGGGQCHPLAEQKGIGNLFAAQ
jgi:hypothetical protein